MVPERMLYSAEEAGALLSVGRTTIYMLMGSGQLQSVRVGRSRRVTRRSLEEFLAAREREAGIEPAASSR